MRRFEGLGYIPPTSMGAARFGWWSVGVVLLGLAVSPLASAAGQRKEPTELYDQATAAFGLGRYEEAARKYEEAFSLQPDPVLLYNAAQSYRLAGNKTRALELYRNLLRIYPDFVNAEKTRAHIAALQKEIAEGRTTSPAPPAGPAVAPAAAPAPRPAAAPSLTPAPAPRAPAMPAVQPLQPSAPPLSGSSAVTTISTSDGGGEPHDSVFRKGWFWGVVGAVVVAGTVGLLVATRGTKYPDATFGTLNGN